MSKLPQIEQRNIPDAPGFTAPRVVSAETSQVPNALNKLGQTLEASGEIAHKIGEQTEKFNYSIARSKFLQQSVDLQNTLENDPDYANLPKKYDEGMQKIKEQTLGELGSNNHSRLLDQEMNLYQSKKYGTVLKFADEKRREVAGLKAYQAADSNLDAIVRTKDQATINSLITTQGELYDAAYLNDPIKAAQAKRGFVERVAETKLEAENPYPRLNLLTAENNKKGSNIAQFLPADKRIDLYNRTLAEVNALEKKKVDTATIDMALNDKITLDPTLKANQDAVDNVWSQKQNDLVNQGATQQQILDSSLDIVGKTGIVPTAIKSSMNANILNGNTQQRAAFSTYLANAADKNPKVLNGLDNQTTSLAFAIAGNIRAGLSQQQSVDWALNSVNEAKKQDYKIRASDWQNQSKKVNKPDNIIGNFQDEPGFDLFTKNPEVPAAMVDEYNRISKNSFINDKVDLETANRLADRTVRSQWGITEIGGERKYMKYAPEVIYGNNNNWVHKQLEGEFKRPISDVQLEVDYSTTNTPKPAYYVFKKNEFGGTEVELDENNLPKRFVPNYQKANEIELEKHNEETKQLIEQSKKERATEITNQQIRERLPLGR